MAESSLKKTLADRKWPLREKREESSPLKRNLETGYAPPPLPIPDVNFPRDVTGRQPTPVRRKRHAPVVRAQSRQTFRELNRPGIPNSKRTVALGGDEAPAIGRERDAKPVHNQPGVRHRRGRNHNVGVARSPAADGAVPNIDPTIFAATDELPAIGHEGQSQHLALMPLQTAKLGLVWDAPNSDRLVRTRRGQPLAVRAEGESADEPSVVGQLPCGSPDSESQKADGSASVREPGCEDFAVGREGQGGDPVARLRLNGDDASARPLTTRIVP